MNRSCKALLLSLAACSPGCGLLRSTLEAPGKLASAATGRTQPTPIDPAEVQNDVLRLADRVLLNVSAALAKFERDAATPAAQLQALRWGKEYGYSALGIATGDRPLENLIELLGFVASRSSRSWRRRDV